MTPRILKVAVTVVFVFKFRVQVVPLPVHPPLQPTKPDRRPGVAVNVTVPPSKVAEHVPEQLLMPAGLDDTVPRPRPPWVTVRVNCCRVKVALTAVVEFTGTLHVPVPEHPPPLQPLNVDPAAALAVRVTTVPAL
jgi:hypothetical protein